MSTTTTTDLSNTEAMEQATSTMLQVYTAPTEVKPPMLAIEWKRRSTKQNPVSEQSRYRAIQIHESAIAVPKEQVSSKFYNLVQSTVHQLAEKMLAEELGETDKREVSAGRYTLDGVLAYWAEEKRRQQINSAQITEWLKESKTYQGLTDNQKQAWLIVLPKMASPGYRNALDGDQQKRKTKAAVILSRLHDDDLSHPACIFIVDRMQACMSDEPAQAALDL